MTDEQRSQTGWIGVQEWVVIFARALRAVKDVHFHAKRGCSKWATRVDRPCSRTSLV